MLRHRRNKHGLQLTKQNSQTFAKPLLLPPPQSSEVEPPPPPPPQRSDAGPPPPPLQTTSTEDHFVFQHPSTGIFSGPTSCGKTFLVKKILQEHLIKPWPWYKVDIDKDSYLNPSIRNLIVLDDVMASSSKDGRITELFTEGSHHRNLSVIAINQNLYFGKDPTQRRNCQYMILFNNPIDQQQIMTLARQMFPGQSHG